MNAAAWQGPPQDTLGYPVPLQQLLARTQDTVVALQDVIAFAEGCSLTLHLTVQRGSLDEPTWSGLVANHSGADPRSSSADSSLKFGVRFPDGSKATTVDNAFPGWARPTDRPEPPMLVDVGGQSASDDRSCRTERRLWLWPLPPSGPFEFVIEWQARGIDATSATLDGAAIVRAAERALPY